MREELKPEIKQSCLDFGANPKAGGVTWKDVTNYSRDDNERVPTVFETNVGGCRITIICAHIHFPNIWIFNCYELGIKERTIHCTTAEDAADAAIGVCELKVTQMYEAFMNAGEH